MDNVFSTYYTELFDFNHFIILLYLLCKCHFDGCVMYLVGIQ